jgi:hypothetical protein
MSDDPWIKVWLQGGIADDWIYATLIEPDREIKVMRDPFHDDRFIRVTGDWPEAMRYERVPTVEQFDNERIYYPVER